ncbi:hypothetical protein CGCVW01_v003696 [Colletotrichum viniferum]|nr:hypothetical protein CGCVW01_v003696 [Colletotrichum viniferum]
MQHSARTLCKIALWGAFSLIAVKAQGTNGLVAGDENDWLALDNVDPWYLPPDIVDGGDKDGSVLILNGRVRCGVVPFDKRGNVWTIPANGDFDAVGYILPRGGYDSRSDKSLADCVLRESKEEGGFIIDINSLIPLGLSKGETVYWYKGTVTETVDPTEPRDRPPKSFADAEARTELQKPAKKPTKKSDMRMAFNKAESASESNSYRSTFKAGGGASAYSFKDAGAAMEVYSTEFQSGGAPIVKVEVDSFLNKLVAEKAESSQDQTKNRLSLARMMGSVWLRKGLAIKQLSAVEFLDVVDDKTSAAITAVQGELEAVAEDFEVQSTDSVHWGRLVSTPLGEAAQSLAAAAGKSVSKISVTSSPNGIVFDLV